MMPAVDVAEQRPPWTQRFEVVQDGVDCDSADVLVADLVIPCRGEGKAERCEPLPLTRHLSLKWLADLADVVECCHKRQPVDERLRVRYAEDACQNPPRPLRGVA